MGGDFTLFLWVFYSFCWGVFFGLSLADITTTTTVVISFFLTLFIIADGGWGGGVLKMGLVFGRHGVYYFFSLYFSSSWESILGRKHLVEYVGSDFQSRKSWFGD